MTWLDGLSAALTAGTQGAAGWLEGQRKGRLEQEARAKELMEQLRQKRRDEQAELMQKAQMEQWAQASKRAAEQEERQGQLDVMNATNAGWRAQQAPLQTGSPLDQPFADIATEQAKGGVTLGGRKMLAPLENPTQRAAREKEEARRQRIAEMELEHKYRMQEKEDPSGGWSISDKYVDEQGQPVMVSARTGALRTLDGQLVKKVGAAGTGAAGGRTTDAQKKANALLMMAKQAVAGLDGDTADSQPKTIAEAVDQKTGTNKSLGNYTPSLMRQMAAGIDMGGVGNYLAGAKLRNQKQFSYQLSDAWLRYTSGAAVPETEVMRFARTFTPLAGDDPQTKRQKYLARAMIIKAMEAGVGYTPWRGDDAKPLPGWVPRMPDAYMGGIQQSAPPDGQVDPYSAILPNPRED